jgi:dolichyl-phosphate-mannose-protein mannosyltransferase
MGFVLLTLLSCLLAASTWRVYSNTWDEPEHLAAGIELLDRGRYEYDTEHPPIVRILMALGPYLAGAHSYGTPPPDGVQEGIDILYSDGHYGMFLTLARLGTLPWLAVLLLGTWFWGRKLLDSESEALLAVLLLASVPPILGHAALATLDVAAAATVLLALYALQCWFDRGRRRDAVFAGLTSGIAVGSKFSAVPFLMLGFIVLATAQNVLSRRKRGTAADAEGASPDQHAAAGVQPSALSPVRRRFAGLAIMALSALVPLFIVYAPLSSANSSIEHRYDLAVGFLLHEQGLSHATGVLLGHLWLPHWAQGVIEGVVAIKAHNDSGHWSFLLGELRSTGWWYFYLVGLAAKTPLPLLATGPIGMAFLARQGWRVRDGWRLAPALLFLTVLVFASSFSHINIGIRHILVLYPFMALGGAHVVTLAWRSLREATVRPVAIVGSAFLVSLVGWQVSTLWTANPDYLPYFNEAIAHPEKVLVDSDLDWGQDLWRLEKRSAEIKIPLLNLAYRGTADLTREALPPYVVMPPWKPVTGWVAISALAQEHNPRGYAWLDAYQPMERVGKTIKLYYIPLAQGARERRAGG